jgi:hypothetical protein
MEMMMAVSMAARMAVSMVVKMAVRLSAVVDSRPFIKESAGDKTLYKVLIAWFPYKPDNDDEKPAAGDDITPTPSPKKRRAKAKAYAHKRDLSDKPLPITIKKEKIEYVDGGRPRFGAATTRALARIKQEQGGDEGAATTAEDIDRARRLSAEVADLFE